jgi:hypothetical protein
MYTDSLSKVGKISTMYFPQFIPDGQTMAVRDMLKPQNLIYLELAAGYREDCYGSLVLVTIFSPRLKLVNLLQLY